MMTRDRATKAVERCSAVGAVRPAIYRSAGKAATSALSHRARLLPTLWFQ